MPDFNKGDFTQQGVNGHVNANLRLNEKRLVNIDMTSNEEAEGCTITGTVTDLLNEKVYGIGAGVSGNIEITENGENINVAPYATATVNVAGGGGAELNIYHVTLECTGGEGYTSSYQGIFNIDPNGEPQASVISEGYFNTQFNEGVNNGTPKNITIAALPESDIYIVESHAYTDARSYTISGNGEVENIGDNQYPYYAVKITGDCTISTAGDNK